MFFFEDPAAIFRAAGVSHVSPRIPNAHIRGSRHFKTPPKFHEKTPRETQSEMVAGEKKARNFGPTVRGPTLGGRTLRVPPFASCLSVFFETKAKRLKHTPIWPKSVWPKSATQMLAKVGQIRMAKVGISRWFEVIRSSTRPPGKGKGKEDIGAQSVPRGRWQQAAQGGRWKGPIATSQSSSKVRSLEAAMAAMGPEESTKTEIALALKRVREQETAHVVFDPEARMAVGRDTVVRLEQVLAAMEDLKGHLVRVLNDHHTLLERIPAVQDVECAWPLFLHSAASRANCQVRVVRPALTEAFARGHDEGLWQCMCEILRVLSAAGLLARDTASLPLALGRFGLRSVSRSRHPLNGPVWRTPSPWVRSRHWFVEVLETGVVPVSLVAAEDCRRNLTGVMECEPSS